MTAIEHDTDPETLPEEVSDRAIAGSFYRVRMVDGDAFTVRISNRDYLAYDLTAPRKKWPRADAAPFLARTFVTWSAAHRDGFVTSGFETYQRECDDIEEVDDEEGAGIAHPSRSTPGAGRS